MLRWLIAPFQSDMSMGNGLQSEAGRTSDDRGGATDAPRHPSELEFEMARVHHETPSGAYKTT